jgi:hypothetical protein
MPAPLRQRSAKHAFTGIGCEHGLYARVIGVPRPADLELLKIELRIAQQIRLDLLPAPRRAGENTGPPDHA